MRIGALRRWAIPIVLVGAFLGQLRLASGYIAVRPGPVAFVSDIVHVDSPQPHGKNLMLVAVFAKRANLLDGVRAFVDSSTQLRPLRDHIPPRLEWSQYTNVLQGMMDESQHVATAVALRHLGVRVEVRHVDGRLDIDLPAGIHFTPNEFAGASAGLLFALEVYDQLSEGTLAGTLLIAGTGDLRLDGSLRSVEGVRQKVVAAQGAEADIFLVPRENLNEAVAAASTIRVIGVDTFAEAVRILERIEEEENSAHRRTLTIP